MGGWLGCQAHDAWAAALGVEKEEAAEEEAVAPHVFVEEGVLGRRAAQAAQEAVNQPLGYRGLSAWHVFVPFFVGGFPDISSGQPQRTFFGELAVCLSFGR